MTYSFQLKGDHIKRQWRALLSKRAASTQKASVRCDSGASVFLLSLHIWEPCFVPAPRKANWTYGISNQIWTFTHDLFDLDKNISDNYGWLKVSKRAVNIWPSHNVRVWRNQSAPVWKAQIDHMLDFSSIHSFGELECLMLHGKRENFSQEVWGAFIRPDKYYCFWYVIKDATQMQVGFMFFVVVLVSNDCVLKDIWVQ